MRECINGFKCAHNHSVIIRRHNIMMWSTAFAVVLSFSCITFAKDIPAGWPSCKRNNPDLNACLLDATEKMRDILVGKGAKDFGFPPLKTFVLPSLRIQQEINPNIIVDIISTNVSIDGLETYKFSEFSFDPTTLKWVAKVEFDYLSTNGHVELNGKLFGTDVNEKGSAISTIIKPRGEFFMDGKIVTKKGKEYYHIDSTSTKVYVEPKGISLKDVVGLSPRIIQTANDLIADDKGTHVQTILKAAEGVMNDIIRSLIGTIPERIPYDKLFPPS